MVFGERASAAPARGLAPPSSRPFGPVTARGCVVRRQAELRDPQHPRQTAAHGLRGRATQRLHVHALPAVALTLIQYVF